MGKPSFGPARGLSRRQALGFAGAAAASLAFPAGLLAAEAPALARIRERGVLRVGLYRDMPPFHEEGRGIDVELGKALAEALKLNFQPMPFDAGESMDDDLRNMVWKGHYLGWGPADVLLHVPVDPPLMRANPQVRILAPYFRERVMIALDTQAFPKGLEGLSDLKGRPVAVPGLSLAGWLLLGAESGALRDTLKTHLPDGVAAAKALLAGEVVAAAGLASELETALSGHPRYELVPFPAPRARDGWAVGCAVRKDAADLADALEQAMQTLKDSGRLAAMFRESRVSWHL